MSCVFQCIVIAVFAGVVSGADDATAGISMVGEKPTQGLPKSNEIAGPKHKGRSHKSMAPPKHLAALHRYSALQAETDASKTEPDASKAEPDASKTKPDASKMDTKPSNPVTQEPSAKTGAENVAEGTVTEVEAKPSNAKVDVVPGNLAEAKVDVVDKTETLEQGTDASDMSVEAESQGTVEAQSQASEVTKLIQDMSADGASVAELSADGASGSGPDEGKPADGDKPADGEGGGDGDGDKDKKSSSNPMLIHHILAMLMVAMLRIV